MLPGEVGRFHLACIVISEAEVKAVVQRVSKARVRVRGETVGEVGPGLCVLLGVALDDMPANAQRLAEKVARLRIFEDDEGRFDRSLLDVGGEALRDLGVRVETGVFGARMALELVNDGPFTILLEV